MSEDLQSQSEITNDLQNYDLNEIEDVDFSSSCIAAAINTSNYFELECKRIDNVFYKRSWANFKKAKYDFQRKFKSIHFSFINEGV